MYSYCTQRRHIMLGETTHPTVVVIDDEPSVLALVCDVLEDDGITAACLLSGVGAHEVVREHHPRVIILDVQMPHVDGVHLFRQLRGDAATANIPVIFLTANVHALYERLPNYPSMGATVLPKPFNITTLLS